MNWSHESTWSQVEADFLEANPEYKEFWDTLPDSYRKKVAEYKGDTMSFSMDFLESSPEDIKALWEARK